MRASPVHAFTLSLALACVGTTPVDTDTDTEVDTEAVTEDLEWFTTCGDPVCQGYTGPFDGVDLCTTEAVGDACSTDGATCDPADDCNGQLICAAEDPKDQPGGCPISRAAAKTSITYLDQAGVAEAAQQAMGLRLATWRYRHEGGEHLGMIIDDAPTSVAVRPDGERMDLYGYTSLALAAAQAQQVQIDALKAELAELRQSCAR